MYFPPKFDRSRAIELCKLVDQAYQQFEYFKQASPWKLQGNYTLVAEISYHTVLSFGVDDGSNSTAGRASAASGPTRSASRSAT